MRDVVKLSKEDISRLYDELYAEGDRVLREHNPCDIKVEDGKVMCAKRREPFSGLDDALCCGRCPNHSPSGCTIKNVNCKLFLCGIAWDKTGRTPTEAARKLFQLQDFARSIGIPMMFFRTKEQVLANDWGKE